LDPNYGFLIGTPEEKLLYVIKTAKSRDDSEMLARGLDRLAQLYDEQNRYAEAELYYLLAIHTLQRAYKKDDLEIGLEYESLTTHYVKCNDLQLAQRANLKALTILRKHESDNPIQLAIVLHNEAWLEGSIGKTDNAENYLLESLDMLKRQFGANHLMVGIAANALAELYVRNSDYHRAEQYLQMALEIVPQSLDTKSITKRMMSNYALVLRKNHKYSAASQIEEHTKSNFQ
jgi:tetratricopeptide (TPR) repeat protein